MNIIHSSEKLYAYTKSGKIKVWYNHALEENENYYTQQVYWQETLEGEQSKKQESTPKQVNGKNIGKKNETTPKDQAIRECESLYKKYLDKGYKTKQEFLSEEQTSTLVLPMLAHPYEKHANKVNFPCYVQSKLDGMRCLYDGSRWWSRQGKLIPSQITDHLNFDTKGHIFDGELILPNEYTFQETISAIKKYNDNTHKLRYVIYDIVNYTAGYLERLELLKSLFYNINNHVHQIPLQVELVINYTANDIESLEKMHKHLIELGYEGSMIRNLAGEYHINHRSYNLLKLKPFYDEEYLITDVVDGSGRECNAAIYKCITPERREFNVKPKGTIQERKDIFSNKEMYIGKLLTVRYQELSQDLIPRFPVGIALRDYE